MKRAFLRRTRREKILVLLLAGAAALVWLASVTSRLRENWQADRRAKSDLADQQLWLDRQVDMENRAAVAVRALEPAKTLDATHLVGEVAALAAGAGLQPVTEAPRTQRTDDFAYHTVQVTFRRAQLSALVAFYRELGNRAPYVALEQVALVADANNPSQLNATFSIFSVQVLK